MPLARTGPKIRVNGWRGIKLRTFKQIDESRRIKLRYELKKPISGLEPGSTRVRAAFDSKQVREKDDILNYNLFKLLSHSG